MGKITVVVLAALSYLLYSFYESNLSDLELCPDLLQQLESEFWGSKERQKGKEDDKIYPFKIQVADAELQDLKKKLNEELTSKRLAPPLEDIGFEYGFNTKYLSEVVTYWRDKYDWRAREKLLNRYPGFKTRIAGIDIHFQHVKSTSGKKYGKTLPLLLLHGWPGSFVELQKIIPLLTDPKGSDVNFELIIPSLPGYGLSEPAVRRGLGPAGIAVVFTKLMERLQFDRYYIHARGDWGSLIVTQMSVLYPQRVLAMHTNACISFHSRAAYRFLLTVLFPSVFIGHAEEVEKMLPWSNFFEFITRETGYLHIQATKPDTVGVGLSYSPSGLAAYILEKFSTWTNAAGLNEYDGLLTKKIPMDELLDNVMVYWLFNSITSSMRLYSENFGIREHNLGLDRVPVQIPTGCLLARNDAYMGQAEFVLRDKFPQIKSYTMAKDGGHFFAMEHPDILAQDIIQFIQSVEKDRK